MRTSLNIKALILFSGLVASLLSGCVATGSKPEEQVSSNVALDTFSFEDHAQVLLRPGVMFSIRVEVGGINECAEDELRVRQDGTAILPMIGSVKVAGLSLSEASDQLADRYSVYYQEMPLIHLRFLGDESGASSPWGYVTVLGRVKNPGRVNLPPSRDLTVSGAIQGANGFDTSANLKAVRISRADTSGKNRQVTVNLLQVGKGGVVGKDVQLKAGDIVFVPETIF